jgi:predicted O-methyltransferase YrrM
MPADRFAIPPASPSKIFSLRETAFAHDLFITAVSHFDFFNRLNESPLDMAGICRVFGIKERPADVMLTLFKAYGLIKTKNKKYHLTDTARSYLTKGSGFDLTSYVDTLKDRPICQDVKKVLLTGRPTRWAAAEKGKDWSSSMEDDAFAESFSAGMNSRGAYLASGVLKAINLSAYKKLLDIGGASGIYAAAFVTAFPHLKASVFEKPPVDKVARYSLKKLGLDKKIGVVAGDVFKEKLPGGYDVHLLSHVLHDWGLPEVKTILKNSYETLKPGGIIVVHSAHINKARTGPLSVAEYSVLLMVLSEGKCYSVGEMQDLLTEAGFKDIEYRPTILNRSIVTARK